MGHEELVRHLIGNAERRKAEILGQAREEAGRRIAVALAQAEAMDSGSGEALNREAARERDLRMSRARSEAKLLELRARASLADDILARLRKRLAQVPAEAGYPKTAERLYREILPEIPAGDITLGADAKALDALEPLTADPRIRRVLLPEEELGGVEVWDEAGTIRIRNTLKVRMENARPVLMATIRRYLAGENE
jgi:V/A-type H+-transporting ATPase subunit E